MLIPSFGLELTISSMEMSLEGRFSVMIFSTLGELGPLETGEANPEDGVATSSISGSEISGSSANELVGVILPVTSENEIGSEICYVVCTR
jgi:hypothetical protein